MLQNALLLSSSSSSSGGGLMMIIYLVIIVVFFYFFFIRPQRKEQKEKDTMLSSLEVGDSVLTTAGFYGIVIDITDDTVIVEFGNNKNCRIPMQKSAIVQIEKPQDAAAVAEDTKAVEKKDDSGCGGILLSFVLFRIILFPYDKGHDSDILIASSGQFG